MPDPAPRFDGAAAWAALDPEARDRLGAVALELAASWRGSDLAAGERELRPYHGAEVVLSDLLAAEAGGLVPALGGDAMPGVPSMLGPVCRVCGCSENDACEEGCGWAEADLCTACAAGDAP